MLPSQYWFIIKGQIFNIQPSVLVWLWFRINENAGCPVFYNSLCPIHFVGHKIPEMPHMMWDTSDVKCHVVKSQPASHAWVNVHEKSIKHDSQVSKATSCGNEWEIWMIITTVGQSFHDGWWGDKLTESSTKMPIINSGSNHDLRVRNKTTNQ